MSSRHASHQPAARRTRGGHLARKRFGQHFLIDAAIIHGITEAIAPREGELIVEIGPGPGALTDALLGRVARLVAIEIDRDLVAALSRRHDPGHLELHQGDALSFDFDRLAAGRAMRLVGNLPYNISSALLVRLAQTEADIVDQHFMLQREVVDRIVASPGNSDYGRLGVLLQARYACESVLHVPREAFDPPPRVESALVRMTRRPSLVRSLPVLSSLLAVAFGNRRKMLRGHLIPWLLERGVAPDGFEPTQRAEDVPQAVYYALADRIAARTLA